MGHTALQAIRPMQRRERVDNQALPARSVQ